MERRRGVVFSYIALCFEIASGLMFTPFLIRSFGKSEYGIYGLVLNITAYMTLLDMGVGNAVVRYISKYRVKNEIDKQKKLLGVTIIFYSIIASIIVGVGFLITCNIDLFFSKGLLQEELYRAKIMLNITFGSCALTMWLYSFNKVIIAYEKFALSQTILIVRIISKIILLVPILLLGGKGIAVVLVDMVLTIILGIFSIFYVLKKIGLKAQFYDLDFGFIKEIVLYSTFIFLQMIATQINAMVDQILIAALVPMAAPLLAVYGLGSQICSYVQRIAASINGVLMPGIVKLVENNVGSDELEKEMVKIGRIIFMILIIIWGNILLFGKTFIKIYAGNGYVSSYWIILLVSFPMVLSLPQSIGTQILWAKDQHKLQALLKMVVAILNIIFTAVLIKWNPLIGAAVGTCLALFLGDVIVMNIVFRKNIGIKVGRYYKELNKGIIESFSLSMIIGMTFKLFETGGIFNFLLNCSCVTLVYAIIMFIRGFNSYEKLLFMSILKKIKIKLV